MITYILIGAIYTICTASDVEFEDLYYDCESENEVTITTAMIGLGIIIATLLWPIGVVNTIKE